MFIFVSSWMGSKQTFSFFWLIFLIVAIKLLLIFVLISSWSCQKVPSTSLTHYFRPHFCGRCCCCCWCLQASWFQVQILFLYIHFVCPIACSACHAKTNQLNSKLSHRNFLFLLLFDKKYHAIFAKFTYDFARRVTIVASIDKSILFFGDLFTS